MARAVWTGAIRFGLVNIPVNLTSAIEPHRVAFHEFQRGTNERIHYKRVAESSGHEVPWDKIEKGYEVSKGHYVMLTDEELEAAEPERSHGIDIETFVPLDEIDPVSWDKAYYVAPDSDSAHKAYELLRAAMERQKRVAIGRFVMRTKEYVVCIRPLGKAMALHTMYYPDEVRSAKDIVHLGGKVAAGKQELAMAEQLLDAMASHWEPSRFKDTFSARVLELVHKKDKGQEIAAAPAKAAPGKVVDLMEALKATLAGQKGKGKGKGKVKDTAASKDRHPSEPTRASRPRRTGRTPPHRTSAAHRPARHARAS
jgi:DNA end-binding protein Ku